MGIENNTICPKLWNSIVIRVDGNVYPCCMLRKNPEKFAMGNIVEEKLENMLNSKNIKRMREESLCGILSCMEGCDECSLFLTEKKYKVTIDQSTIVDYVDLQIEYSEFCNADCVMCWQNSNDRRVLPYDALIKNLPIENWKYITVYGGEILIIKEVLDHVFHMADCNNRIILFTNGKALSDDLLAKKLVQKISGVNISLNAISEKMHTFVFRPKNNKPFFNEVIENIQKLKKYRKELNKPEFNISGHFTAIKETLHEIPQFLKTSEEIGFDWTTVTFDHRYFPEFFVENPEIKHNLETEVRNILRQMSNTSRVRISMLEV